MKESSCLSKRSVKHAANLTTSRFWSCLSPRADALYGKSNKPYALPNIPKLLKKFGGTGSKASSPTARISIAYDVFNDYVMDAGITPVSMGEREHAMNQIDAVEKLIKPEQELYIFDRGYPSEELIRRLAEKSHYLIRVKKKFYKITSKNSFLSTPLSC